MAEAKPVVNTIARERVDNLASTNGEPGWLKDMRVSAWEAYLQTPMPTPRDEDWKKTEIESLNLSSLNAIDLSSQDTSATLPQWFETALTFFDNRSAVVAEVGQSSIATELPANLKQQGVIFCSIKTALRDHADLIRPYLCKINADGKFVLMNKALFNSGTFLYIPANVEIDGPFLSLTHFTSTNGSQTSGVAIFPRLIAVVGKHSKASLINVLSSDGEPTAANKPLSLANTLVEVHLESGANFEYLELQKFDGNVFAITRTNNEVDQDATLKSLTVGVGGSQLKSDIATKLNARGANSELLGIVLGDTNEHYSFNTIQKHNAPDTTSNISFRVALKGNAQSIYQGIIEVAKIAQRIQAMQSNKNLLLGSEARADSIPKLEILADDVKCSHGATVGPVDREQVFYLMSRGLTAPEAEELIVTGFFRQILEACTIGRAKEWIYDLLADKIHNV